MMRAAADAEQAGEDAGDESAGDDHSRKQQQLADGTPRIMSCSKGTARNDRRERAPYVE